MNVVIIGETRRSLYISGLVTMDVESAVCAYDITSGLMDYPAVVRVNSVDSSSLDSHLADANLSFFFLFAKLKLDYAILTHISYIILFISHLKIHDEVFNSVFNIFVVKSIYSTLQDSLILNVW